MSPGEAAAAVRETVREAVEETNQKIMKQGTEAANELRNSTIEMLTNSSPSAPGSRPGVRSGHHREAWNYGVSGGASAGGGVSIEVYGEAQAKYAGYLEDGTYKMAARPYVDAIIDDVESKIVGLFSDI